MNFRKGKALAKGIWKIIDSRTIIWKITKTSCRLQFNDKKDGLLVNPRRNPPSILRKNEELPKKMKSLFGGKIGQEIRDICFGQVLHDHSQELGLTK
jgi:hypothetical protein